MSENPNVERAAKVIARYFAEDVTHPFRYPRAHGTAAVIAARAADDSGLLVTPLHERALEAVETYAVQMGCVGGLSPFAHTLVVLGRESLALKEKAKGAAATCSYAIAPTGDADQHWSVLNEHGEAVYMGPKSQARRVAAALNEGGES